MLPFQIGRIKFEGSRTLEKLLPLVNRAAMLSFEQQLSQANARESKMAFESRLKIVGRLGQTPSTHTFLAPAFGLAAGSDCARAAARSASCRRPTARYSSARCCQGKRRFGVSCVDLSKAFTASR
jgi:hypothetical protein